ncbi:unnamed protein product [Fraxinus pennsylvanica]|uniref:O-fucosyltransferase family protein n=1 Tax=Fraxinus pennsylvanica TaxID=56036 RepID=A0AAD1ZCX6_9LAMI|nr:unnamed protein product [Fraxinus pennsylvanica]
MHFTFQCSNLTPRQFGFHNTDLITRKRRYPFLSQEKNIFSLFKFVKFSILPQAFKQLIDAIHTGIPILLHAFFTKSCRRFEFVFLFVLTSCSLHSSELLLWALSDEMVSLPAKSNGYIRVDCYGGLNQMRRDLCDGVGVARLLNATLVLPKFEVAAYWNESRYPLYAKTAFCHICYNALRLTSTLEKKASELLEAIPKSFLSLHLRFEPDMVAYSQCEYSNLSPASMQAIDAA